MSIRGMTSDRLALIPQPGVWGALRDQFLWIAATLMRGSSPTVKGEGVIPFVTRYWFGVKKRKERAFVSEPGAVAMGSSTEVAS